VIEVVRDTIRYGPVCEKGSKTADARDFQGRIAMHVEICFLLAGERGKGKVFGSSRTADCDIGIRAILLAELIVGSFDLRPQIIRDTCLENDVSCFAASCGQVLYIAYIKALHGLPELIENTCGLQHVPVGICGDSKTIGYFDAFVLQFPVHFPDGSVLPSHLRYILDPYFSEPANVSCSRCCIHEIPHLLFLYLYVNRLAICDKYLFLNLNIGF